MLVAQPWSGHDGQCRSAHFVHKYDEYVGDNDNDDDEDYEDDDDDVEKKVSGVDWRLGAGEEGVAGDWGAGNYTASQGLIRVNNNNNNNNANNNDNNAEKNNSNMVLSLSLCLFVRII